MIKTAPDKLTRRERLDVLQVRKFMALGMSHRKYANGEGEIITTVMIPPSYRSVYERDGYTMQAALPEDN